MHAQCEILNSSTSQKHKPRLQVCVAQVTVYSADNLIGLNTETFLLRFSPFEQGICLGAIVHILRHFSNIICQNTMYRRPKLPFHSFSTADTYNVQRTMQILLQINLSLYTTRTELTYKEQASQISLTSEPNRAASWTKH